MIREYDWAGCNRDSGQCPLAQRMGVAQGLMEHLEASHWRLHFAGAAGFLGTDYLVEARIAAEYVDNQAGYDAEADLASVTAEFERRFPTWQVRSFQLCSHATRSCIYQPMRRHLAGAAL